MRLPPAVSIRTPLSNPFKMPHWTVGVNRDSGNLIFGGGVKKSIGSFPACKVFFKKTTQKLWEMVEGEWWRVEGKLGG